MAYDAIKKMYLCKIKIPKIICLKIKCNHCKNITLKLKRTNTHPHNSKTGNRATGRIRMLLSKHRR